MTKEQDNELRELLTQAAMLRERVRAAKEADDAIHLIGCNRKPEDCEERSEWLDAEKAYRDFVNNNAATWLSAAEGSLATEEERFAEWRCEICGAGSPDACLEMGCGQRRHDPIARREAELKKRIAHYVGLVGELRSRIIELEIAARSSEAKDCPRCGKQVSEGAHTCNPTALQRAEDRAEKYRAALEFIRSESPEACDPRTGLGHDVDCAKMVADEALAADTPTPQEEGK